VQIVPAADPTSRNFLVKVELLLTRGYALVFSDGRDFPVVSVLRCYSAFSSSRAGTAQGVYVMDTNQIAGMRYITLGKSAGIRSKFSPGCKLAKIDCRTRRS